MKITDTHCHLNFKAFKKDLSDVIENAKIAGVEKIIVPGAKLHSSKLAVEIAGKYENIFAAVGVHPHHASEPIDLNEIRTLAQNKKTTAIGEIGLDHHWYKNSPELTAEDRERQVKLFCAQLEIALELNKPVIIHCREAQELIISTIGKFTREKGKFRGVFHCFEGDAEFLKKVLDFGFYVGCDGNITYPENIHLRDAIKHAPMDRILLETDAPFLSPQNYRGKRNEPKHIVETLEFLSREFGVETSEFARTTCDNAENLFFG